MSKNISASICALNSKYIHSSLAPWYLKAAADKNCCGSVSVHVIEGTINENAGDILGRILESRPDLIGFSCYIWNITCVKALVGMVRSALPKCKIVLGGPEVSYNPEEYLTGDASADFVISGEGETPFSMLLSALANDIDFSGIPGLSYKSGGALMISEPNTESSEPPSPYTPEYFSALGGRITYLETSRGCPFSCAFCLSGRCGKARHFDIAKAKEHIVLLANSGTKTVKFVDRTFNADKAHCREIISFIKESGGRLFPDNVCFHFEIAGDILDDETIQLLSSLKLGIVQLEIGLQSFNENTLAAISRKTDTEKLTRNISRLISFGNMHIHIDLIAGLPHEGLESFAESFNKAYALGSHMLQLGFLKLLHGAPMREQPDEFPCEFSTAPPYQVISTPWLDSDDIKLLQKTENCLDRLYNSGRFRSTLRFLLSATGYSPFELFSKIAGELCSYSAGTASLDEYTEAVFNIMTKIGVEPSSLRDCMISDRLKTDSSGILPKYLRIYDSNLKTAKKLLEENPCTKKLPGRKRGISLLTSKHEVVYADYDTPHPVTGEYELKHLTF